MRTHLARIVHEDIIDVLPPNIVVRLFQECDMDPARVIFLRLCSREELLAYLRQIFAT
jgi:hypothetical protein